MTVQDTEIGRRGSVLVVDDEHLILQMLRRVLEHHDYRVSTAGDAGEALDLVSAGEFNAVVTDISMPGMDGVELLRAIRVKDEDVPIILMTGGPSLQTAIQAVELGALKYLTKPIDHQEFVKAVGFAVRMHRLAVAKRQALAHLGETHALPTDLVALRAAFEGALDHLWIAYQPIVSWKRRQVWGYEALVRSDEEAMPHPGVLFDAAERLDRVHDLGRAIRSHVAADMVRIPGDAVILVNLHPHDLLDPELVAAESALSAIAPRVVLELTERVSLDRIPKLTDRLSELRARGFRLAVDDLGAGYAGLSAFAAIEPEVAKIDMSLIRGVDRDPTKLRLIQAMVDVCSELEIQVVNEGVETREERSTLAGIGCDLMQGYLFAKPHRDPPAVEL